MRDLLTYHDAERTAFDIINRYMRFADKEVDKRRSEWKTNERWAYFIDSDRGHLKLTIKPEPYTLTRTLNWISRQVAPTWKILQQIHYYDVADGTALAEYLICEECIFSEIPHELQKHIDYRSYGNELEMQDRYLFTPSGVFRYQ